MTGRADGVPRAERPTASTIAVISWLKPPSGAALGVPSSLCADTAMAHNGAHLCRAWHVLSNGVLPNGCAPAAEVYR